MHPTIPAVAAARRFASPLRSSPARWPAAAVSGAAHSPPLPRTQRSRSVDVYDRADRLGRCRSIEKDGRHYIVGMPGHEYALRIRNTTGQRILAVTSVDGVNVVTGETATPSQSGYVIDPWGRVEIAGWRKSLSRTAAFYFTEHSNSYAARTGRPHDVGVIGVAVFAERAARQPMRISESADGARGRARREAKTEADAAAPASAAPPMPIFASDRGSAASARGTPARPGRSARARCERPTAGEARHRTRTQRDVARRQVAFERATSDPAADRRDPVRPPREPGRAGRAPRAAAITMRAVRRSRSPACASRPIRGSRRAPVPDRALRRPRVARILRGPCPPLDGRLPFPETNPTRT